MAGGNVGRPPPERSLHQRTRWWDRVLGGVGGGPGHTLVASAPAHRRAQAGRAPVAVPHRRRVRRQPDAGAGRPAGPGRRGLVDLDAFTAVVRGLSITELQELYELREAVEPVLTRIAVPNVGRAEVTQMTTLIEVMESSPSGVDWLAANANFHALVYSRADRARMIELTEQLRRLTDRYLYLHVGVFGDTGHIHEEHRQILQAVRNGDAAGAAELRVCTSPPPTSSSCATCWTTNTCRWGTERATGRPIRGDLRRRFLPRPAILRVVTRRYRAEGRCRPAPAL